MRLAGICIFILLLLLPDLSLYGQDTKRFLNLRWGRRIARYMKKMATGDYTLEDKIIEHDKMVVASEPSWLIQEGNFDEYYYNLLSDIVIAEYDIHPLTGDYRSRSALYSHLDKRIEVNNLGADQVDFPEPANILQCANTVNPRIRFLAQLSYFGDFGPPDLRQHYYEYFLTNRGRSGDLHRVLTDTLSALATKWEKDYGIGMKRRGLVIDFKHVFYSPSADEDFIKFIKTIHDQLVLRERYSKLYLKLDVGSLLTTELIRDLSKYIDLFIVKGYVFEPDSGEPSSPSAVFDTLSPISMQAILASARARGISESKMLFEFPYFGSVWRQSRWREFLDPETPIISLDDLYPRVVESGVQHIDSSYATYAEETLRGQKDEDLPRVYCFEDSLTLATKYRWLDQQGFPGVALWGLGYNTKSQSVKYWEAIADRYSRPPPEIVWYGVGLVFFLMSMGFPYALLHSWEVRNITAKYTKYAWRVIGISLLFFLFFVICSNPGLRNTVGLMVGAAILAIYAFLMIIRRYLMRARRYMRYAGVKT